jgi:hypothetical protein
LPGDTELIDGVGLTVIVKFWLAPVQPDADGVTMMVPAMADVPAFVPMKDAILPVPDEASPMEVLLLVQV